MTEGIQKRKKAAAKSRPVLQSMDEAPTLEQELLQLVDAFAEFHAVNAFLCSSFTAILSPDEPPKQDVIQGAKHFSGFLQIRARELKYDLELFRERYIRERSETRVRK